VASKEEKEENNRKILFWPFVWDLGERKGFLRFYLKTSSIPMLWNISK